MLLGEDMMNIKDLANQGLNIMQIAQRSGRDRKTVRKYLARKEPPAYGPRKAPSSKLDPFKPYVRMRMDQGMTNGVKMLREIRGRGYEGGMTVLKNFMHPHRPTKEMAIMRFETLPGHQAQVDWGHCGRIIHEERLRPLYCFVMTLGYSRMMYVEFTVRANTHHFLRCHVNALDFFEGAPKEVLYDNTKSVALKRFYEKITLNPRFQDMAAHYGFTPRLCRPYRPQTKGKVESGIKYVKGNFLLGEVFASLDEINTAASSWLETVANARVHGTTGEVPKERFAKEELMPIGSIAPFDTSEHVFRRVTLDCLISYRGCRYSVPHHAAGKVVLVKEGEGGVIRIFLDGEHLTSHQSSSKGRTIIIPDHYRGIATQPPRRPMRLPIHGLGHVPTVETRDLAVYEEVI